MGPKESYPCVECNMNSVGSSIIRRFFNACETLSKNMFKPLIAAVADSADVYGEISGITGEDSSGDDIVDFSGKLGVKYTF